MTPHSCFPLFIYSLPYSWIDWFIYSFNKYIAKSTMCRCWDTSAFPRCLHVCLLALMIKWPPIFQNLRVNDKHQISLLMIIDVRTGTELYLRWYNTVHLKKYNIFSLDIQSSSLLKLIELELSFFYMQIMCLKGLPHVLWKCQQDLYFREFLWGLLCSLHILNS